MITALRLLGVWLLSLIGLVMVIGARTDALGWFLLAAMFWSLPVMLCLLLARMLEESPVGASAGLLVAGMACGVMAVLRFDDSLFYAFAAFTGALWSGSYGIVPLKRHWQSV